MTSAKGRVGLSSLAVLGTALTAANKVLVGRETTPAESDGGQILKLPGGDIHVRQDGPGDAPPIVLVHGFAGSLHWFDRLAPLLAEDRRVIRVDLLGHGGSEKPGEGYTIENQARLVELALEQLDVSVAVVVGHSMGGAVATALADRSPGLVSGLVVLDEGPDTSFGSTPLLARLGFLPLLGEMLHRVTPDGMVRDGYRDAFAKGFDLAAGFDDPDQVVRDFRRMTFTSYKQSNAGEEHFLDSEPLNARLRRLGKATLVLFGEEDRFFRARESARAFDGVVPGARVEVVPGVGHSPNVEAPERIAELVRAFGQSSVVTA